MRHLIIIILLSFSCDSPKQSEPAVIEIRKIVKTKKEAQKTDFKYSYNLFEGKFQQLPDIHTVYYLIYTDGTHDQVNIDDFVIYEAGDTVVKTYNQY